MSLPSEISAGPTPRPIIMAAIVFMVSAIFAGALIWSFEQHRLQIERADVAGIAADHAYALQRTIEQSLSSVYSLAALVRQGNGSFPDFEAVAQQMLLFYPGAALGLAPGGVVQSIVPLAGNEGAIGHDMLKDPNRSKESLLAVESRTLTLAGPFKLVQGGLGAVGRLPVFLDNEDGSSYFWGFATVLIKFPQSLESAGLPKLVGRGFNYQLWRIQPDNGQKQVIASSSSFPLTNPVERNLEVPNGVWTLSVAPVKGWSDSPGTSIRITLGLLFSLLLAFVTKLLFQLKEHQQGLEALVEIRTDEVRAREAELNRALKFYLTILDDQPALIWRAGADAKCDYFNAAWLAFAGRTLEQEQGDGWAEGVHPDDYERCLQIFLGAFSAREPFDMEYRLRHNSGEYRWIMDYGRPYHDLGGNFAGYIGTCFDIEDRKQYETELVDKNNELERFTYTVSHDLKSPLITIESFAGQIRNDLQTGRMERIPDDLNRISAAAGRLTALLNDLLELSRIGRVVNQSSQIDMNLLLKDVLAQLAGPLKQRQVEVVVQPELPPVYGDRQRISMVLQNLVENAVKYMGDQVSPCIRIGTKPDVAGLTFCVEDNGKGIDRSYHENIFGLFNKLEPNSAGTGIGLALVKRIIEMHEGRIWVESEGAGKGSSFCFTLPREG